MKLLPRLAPLAMRQCRVCGEEKPLSAFSKGRTQCYSCAYKKAGGSKHNAEYHSQYYKTYQLIAKHKAYKHKDKSFGFFDTIDKEQALLKMKEPCFYCGKEHSLGLDRIDNTLGHSDDNVRPCCEKCNNILGDIPDEAKLLLKVGLTEIRKQGLLETWTIPTKRKKS